MCVLSCQVTINGNGLLVIIARFRGQVEQCERARIPVTPVLLSNLRDQDDAT